MRVATPRDLDRAAALASLLFAGHASAGPRLAIEPAREGELRALLAACLADPLRWLLVAETEGGALAGFAAGSRLLRPGPFVERERGSVDWLFVREEARRQGLGRALVEAVLGWLREQGVARVEVQVARTNPGGRAFWRALGFTAQMDVLERPL